MPTIAQLLKQKCQPRETALADDEVAATLAAVDGWRLDGRHIARTFAFGNYYETLAFVNAIAYVFHIEDHHPELTVTYNRCVVKLDTHSVNAGAGGLSENDFICAAKVNAIFAHSFA